MKGELCYFISDNRNYDEERDIETDWKLSSIPGRTDALLLRLSTGRQMEYSEYAMIYYLDTKEVEDLFAGIDPAVLEESDGSIWSPGTRRALITGRAGPDFPSGREWLYDRENGHETISCRVYHISSGQAVQTLERSPYYRQQAEAPYGIIPFYGSCCMEIGQDGTACLIDLTTGVRTELENFVFQGAFIAFDREGYDNLREGAIGWADKNTVRITADVRDSEPETRYMILYQF